LVSRVKTGSPIFENHYLKVDIYLTLSHHFQVEKRENFPTLEIPLQI
jgi:hypothetical protein